MEVTLFCVHNLGCLGQRAQSKQPCGLNRLANWAWSSGALNGLDLHWWGRHRLHGPNHIRDTLRTDLPHRDGAERAYAGPSPATRATTHAPPASSSPSTRQRLLVSEDTFTRYDDGPETYAAIPLSTTQSSQINAEYVYRGSTIHPTGCITLPTPTHETAKADAVEHRMDTIRTLPHHDAIAQAYNLWTSMLDAKTYPTDEQTVSLIANLQFATIRDQLTADIPGIDEPMKQVLLAQTHTKPQWSRIEWAQQLLLHAYTQTSNHHAAPILTAIGYINWWEGRGSKAHQFLQLALEADPNYRLARLSWPNAQPRNDRTLEHRQTPRLPPPRTRSLLVSESCSSK